MSVKLDRLRALEKKNKSLRKRLTHLEGILSGNTTIPKLHILNAKIGERSISIGGSAITFGDGEADPDATGELQRNGANLLYHDGTDAIDLTVGRGALTTGMEAADGTDDALFLPIGGETITATEADIHVPIPYEMVVRRLVGMCDVNGSNGDTILSFRDDGGNAASAVLGTSVASSFDSGAQAVTVAAGSKCNFGIDTSERSSGTIRATGMIAFVDISLNL